jgi:hypothetical protein
MPPRQGHHAGITSESAAVPGWAILLFEVIWKVVWGRTA